MTHSLANLMKSYFSHYLTVQLEWLNSLGKRPELCGVNRDVMNKTARVVGLTSHYITAPPSLAPCAIPSIHGHKKSPLNEGFLQTCVIRPQT